MNIEDITIKEAREIAAMFGCTLQPAAPIQQQGHPYKIGGNYAIRTVTMMHTGKLIAAYPQELVMVNAAWVADTGRFQQAMRNGDFSEVEMFPDKEELIIGRGALVDACQIATIPTSQK